MAPKSAPAEKPSGPKYGEMAKEAILAMKGRGGSSLPAIKKWLKEHYPNATNEPALKQALKHAVTSGAFVKVKASYKVSADAKKTLKRKPAASKGASTKGAKKPTADTDDDDEAEAPPAETKKKASSKGKTAVKKASAKPSTKKAAAKKATPAAKKSAAKPKAKAAAKPKKAITKKAKASPKKK
ncbi:hypothetical protein KFE25_008523 [Diacronema lutheri]|uniref:H15 domain-containing protein n=2 Tax=Diacronema lutheri TaxID=2081491 RepID=A0A8J5XX38_DIALT|nr:hypothetical protein KFE25_008523 [Diacronema lutheri]